MEAASVRLGLCVTCTAKSIEWFHFLVVVENGRRDR